MSIRLVVSIILTIAAAAIILASALGIVSMAASVSQRRLGEGMEPKLVLYRLSRFVRYMHWIGFIPFVLISVSLVYYDIHWIRPRAMGFLCGVVIEAAWYASLKMVYSIPVYSVLKRIQHTQAKRSSIVFRQGLQSFAIALVYGLWVASSMLLGVQWQQQHPLLSTLYLIGTFALIFFAGGFIMKTVLRKTPLRPEQVPARWQELASASGLTSVQFYIWNVKRWRIANAMALGMWRNFVFVSDYLLDNISEAEADAVVAHEFGHLKKRHMWWMFAFVEGWFPLVQMLQVGLRSVHVAQGIITLLVLLLLGIYQGLIYHWLSRRFEYQADAHARAVMGRSTEMVSALEKLSELNFSLTRIPRFDEWWMTHPSTAHRIEHLQTVTETVGR